MAEWLRQWRLRDMSSNPSQIKGGVCSTSKSYLNEKYQLPVYQSICMRACAFEFTSDLRICSGTFLFEKVTDGPVVKMAASQGHS